MARRWTKEEIDFLKKNYDKLTVKQIAEILGRSVNSVQHKAIRLGLRKTYNYYNIGRGLFKILEKKIMESA